MALLLGLTLSCRCWFESDDEFAVRCVFEREQGKAKYEAARKRLGGGKKKAVAAPSGTQGRIATKGTSSGGSMSQWSSIGKKKATPASSRPAPKAATTGGFAAAFGDDSSDEDSS
jgi:hypothetical protein